MAGIYIHIPFCSQACHYCDFHFTTKLSFVTEVCESIRLELDIQKKYLDNQAIETIYFGGGTPSILELSKLENILDFIFKQYQVNTKSEITLEANPDDLTPEKVAGLKSLGFNRLSIGVQSFDDDVLKFLNRSHSKEQAIRSIENSRAAGFDNLNVDLIYAIPNRNNEKLNSDLSQLTELEPEHISAYSLTIEEKTVFGKWLIDRKFIPVRDDENATQFEIVFDRLSESGYDQYEISNYSKPGFEAQHNSNYWKQKHYLGIGPSAHSFNGVSRQVNISKNKSYINSIRLGIIPASIEILKREDRINEYIMTSLRTKWGCDLNYLKVNHQFDLAEVQSEYIEPAIKTGLIELRDSTLFLTQKGKMHADKLSSDLFLIN